jgi:flavodoxin/predicted small lipoprotein YifL
MKKIISLFMVLTMVLSLAACSTNQSPSESTPEESSSQTNESTPTPSNTNGKNLVVYFSMPDNVDDSTVVIDGETLGNTQYMAYVIQETVGADIFRIEPETPYPTDHDELVDLASEEQSNNARPAIKDTIENFDTYENIFVGYPNWWGDMPMILYSFFDEYDFSGKTIVPFCTSEGSGISSSVSNLEELTSGATWLDGQRLNGSDSLDTVMEWVNSLGLDFDA